MSKKPLSVFALVMINVIAVDSIKNLPMAATFGSSVLGAYLVLGLAFFLPVVMVTAELAVRYPASGGVYHWVKAGLGARAGFMSMWIMWIYNVIWYPTILSLASATFAYIFFPELAASSAYTVFMVLSLFWLATWINLKGMRASSLVSTLGAIFGTMIPMFVIIALGTWWLATGQSTGISFAPTDFLPLYDSFGEYVFFAAIIFSLMGIEMSSVHAEEVANPKKDYPKALLISSLLILLTISLASFALAVIIPPQELDIMTGAIQVFNRFGVITGLPIGGVFSIAMALGAVAAVVTWAIGPTKGLLAAARDGFAPKFLRKSNGDHTPTNILWVQAIIVSLLSVLYIVMPSVQSAYWFLSAMSAELAMVMYLLVFVSAFRLSDKLEIFPSWLYKLSLVLGSLTCLVVMLMGMIPPKNFLLDESASIYYVISMLTGMCLAVAPVLLVKRVDN